MLRRKRRSLSNVGDYVDALVEERGAQPVEQEARGVAWVAGHLPCAELTALVVVALGYAALLRREGTAAT